MIHVVATIELQAGSRDEFLAAFRGVMPTVHREDGCIEYGPAVDATTDIPAQAAARDNVVVVMEKWESLEALRAHLAAPHMNEYREKVAPWVVQTSLQILEPA